MQCVNKLTLCKQNEQWANLIQLFHLFLMSFQDF